MSLNNYLRSRRGLTLIEILVVVVIIMVLMSGVLVAVAQLQKKAKKRQAQLEASSIESAIHTYFNEYGRFPLSDADNLNISADIVYKINNFDNVILYMLVSSTTKEKNPRGVIFLRLDDYDQAESTTPDYAENDLLDPWGKPYKFRFDTNNDNNPNGGVDVTYSKASGY